VLTLCRHAQLEGTPSEADLETRTAALFRRSEPLADEKENSRADCRGTDFVAGASHRLALDRDHCSGLFPRRHLVADLGESTAAGLVAQTLPVAPRPGEDLGSQVGRVLTDPRTGPYEDLTDVTVVNDGERVWIV